MKKLLTLTIITCLTGIISCEKGEVESEHENTLITHTVFAGNFYYDPPNITINIGEQVRWINDGGLHDVNGEINTLTNLPFDNPEVFNSPSTSIAGAEIYKHTFNIPGTYNYDCSVSGHAMAGMVGTITVK